MKETFQNQTVERKVQSNKIGIENQMPRRRSFNSYAA